MWLLSKRVCLCSSFGLILPNGDDNRGGKGNTLGDKNNLNGCDQEKRQRDKWDLKSQVSEMEIAEAQRAEGTLGSLSLSTHVRPKAESEP